MLAIFPQLAAVAASQDTESLACLVRSYFGGPQKYLPQIDMMALASNAGIEISSISIKDYGAITAKDTAGSFTVNIVLPHNLKGDHFEKNFLIGHLLGHFFLHIQPFLLRGEWSNTGFKEEYRPLLRYQQDSYSLHQGEEMQREQIADLFAAAILLPKSLLIRAREKLQDTKAMADFFGVSVLFLERRWAEISIDNMKPQNFMAAEQQSKEIDAKMEPPRSSAINQELAQEMNSSVSRAPASLAQGVYGKKAHKPQSSGPTAQSKEGSKDAGMPLEKSLKMFRELANRLDSSVDIE